jgi:hypothetical protein
MRIRLSKSRVWSGIFVCGAVLGVTSLGIVHATDKVDICHFQPGQGSWNLLSVDQSAADAHLKNHDDALPGGTTSQTGTLLDADCQPYLRETLPGDYDGDGKTDLALRDRHSSTWYILESRTGQLRTVQFGWSLLAPVPGDYDGDGKTDLALRDDRYSSTWYILESRTGQLRTVQFGWPALVPVPGDYDGDSRTDIALFDRQEAIWYILLSSTGQLRTIQFGW